MNRDEIIKGLRCCAGDGSLGRVCPDDCPYQRVDEEKGVCSSQVIWDALRLLEEDQRLEDDGK